MLNLSSNAFYHIHTHTAVARSSFKKGGREHMHIVFAEIGIAEIGVKVHLRQDYPIGIVGFVGEIKRK